MRDLTAVINRSGAPPAPFKLEGLQSCSGSPAPSPSPGSVPGAPDRDTGSPAQPCNLLAGFRVPLAQMERDSSLAGLVATLRQAVVVAHALETQQPHADADAAARAYAQATRVVEQLAARIT